jgi:hypothetical protein
MGQIIGRIIEVRGLVVRAKLDKLFPPYIVSSGDVAIAPKINSYVKSKIGLETVICQVIGEYSEEREGRMTGHYLHLQVRGNISHNKFIQGLRMLPIVDATIQMLDESDYKLIYQVMQDKKSLALGFDLFDEKRLIYVGVNHLMPTHIGIFGNTGSGKSNTVARVLHEYHHILDAVGTKRGKLLIFDINNEYGGDAICAESQKSIYKLTTYNEKATKISLCLSGIMEDDFIALFNAAEKSQLPIIKAAYRGMSQEVDEERQRWYKGLLQELDNKGAKDSFRVAITPYLSEEAQVILKGANSSNNPSISDIPEGILDRFFFELVFASIEANVRGVQSNFFMSLVFRAKALIEDLKMVFDFREDVSHNDLFNNKRICVIQLGNVTQELKDIIPAVITHYFFNHLRQLKEADEEPRDVISFVIDEAHSILTDSHESHLPYGNSLRIFNKIIKEGRKFGCFLIVASQRPSDVSTTIISQLHNYFIHKLVNPLDLQKIRQAVAYLDEQSLDYLSVLAPGQCIVSGTAFQMPVFMAVDQVDEAARPHSENVKLVGDGGVFEKGEKDEAAGLS